jgi:lipoprotein-releasing system ATP-binding protein
VSLGIEEKLITVIMGASGAGKSTLLHILGGLDKPTSGSVTLNNRELYKLDDDSISGIRNSAIGFVFQFHHLLPEFTALENINIPQLIAGKTEKQATKRSRELLEIVGLNERNDHKPAELSGGEQQRIAVARALANNPRIILADEPTGNLDSKNSEVLNQLFIKLKNEFNYTFLIVTHNSELMNIADRVVEMQDGRLIKN